MFHYLFFTFKLTTQKRNKKSLTIELLTQSIFFFFDLELVT